MKHTLFGFGAIAAAVIVAAPCGSASAQTGNARERALVTAAAKTRITEDFRNPDGATLRNVVIWNIGRGGTTFHVCGEVNGTNGFGAFTGYRRFSVSVTKNGSSYSSAGPMLDDPEIPGIAPLIEQSCAASRFPEAWRF